MGVEVKAHSLISMLFLLLLPGCVVDNDKKRNGEIGNTIDTTAGAAITIDSSVFKSYSEKLECVEYKSIGGPPGGGPQVYSYSHLEVSGIQLLADDFRFTINDSSLYFTSHFNPSGNTNVLDSTKVREYEVKSPIPVAYEAARYPFYINGELPRIDKSDTLINGMNRTIKGIAVTGDTIKLHSIISGYKYGYINTWDFVIGRGFIRYSYKNTGFQMSDAVNTLECKVAN
jgi:hypothetical protein